MAVRRNENTANGEPGNRETWDGAREGDERDEWKERERRNVRTYLLYYVLCILLAHTLLCDSYGMDENETTRTVKSSGNDKERGVDRHLSAADENTRPWVLAATTLTANGPLTSPSDTFVRVCHHGLSRNSRTTTSYLYLSESRPGSNDV